MNRAYFHKGKHPHGHGHDHGHDPHQHNYGATRVTGADQVELPRGAAQGQLLFFDAQSGIAGDMTIAALLDLGVPHTVVQECVSQLGLQGVKLHAERVMAGAIGATRFIVEVTDKQTERSYHDIQHLIEDSRLAAAVKQCSLRIFARLAAAEAQVHRVDVADVHFHEVGAVDSIVDIVGAAACLHYLGGRVVASPLPLGHGSVQCRHGVIPLPAPATVLCLQGVPTYGVDVSAELVTPTGAAIIATVAEGFCNWPSLKPQRVGYGKGSYDIPGRFSALRIVLGEQGTAALPLTEQT